MYIVVLGPAGSGKSTLVASYSRWLESELGARVARINLDPAAEIIPYKTDYDVRALVDARDIARRYRLGPNGALVKAMESLLEYIDEVIDEIKMPSADYILLDTPGQMEVFLFREISVRLMESLQGTGRPLVGLYIIDSSLVGDPADYAFQLLLAVAAQLRLGVEVAPILNKADLPTAGEFTGDLHSDFPLVSARLRSHSGLYSDMMRELLRRILFYTKRVRVPRVSALFSRGLDEVHRLVVEMRCACGDLS